MAYGIPELSSDEQSDDPAVHILLSEGIGFGTRTFLPKYRFETGDVVSEMRFPFRFDYYVNPLMYAPFGDPWQRHPYRVRVNVDLRLKYMSRMRAQFSVRTWSSWTLFCTAVRALW